MSIMGKPLLIGLAIGKASGDVVTFRGDGSPLRGLTVGIEPVQAGSGDPSPDNVRPISGWNEIALNQKIELLSPSDFEQGGITWSDGTEVDEPDRVRTPYIPVQPSTPYTIILNSGFQWYDRDYKANHDYFQTSRGWNTTPYTVTSFNKNARYIRLVVRKSASNLPISPSDITVASFSTLITYPITLPSEAGTVYGGYIHAADGSAELVVDRALITFVGDAAVNWTFTTSPSKACVFTTYLSNAVKKNPTGYNDNIKSNYLAASKNSNNYPEVFTAKFNNLGSLLIGVPSSITSASAWKNYLAANNLQLVYELATPITYQLSPIRVQTLLGQNVIWADSGDVSVEYTKRSLMFMS